MWPECHPDCKYLLSSEGEGNNECQLKCPKLKLMMDPKGIEIGYWVIKVSAVKDMALIDFGGYWALGFDSAKFAELCKSIVRAHREMRKAKRRLREMMLSAPPITNLN